MQRIKEVRLQRLVNVDDPISLQPLMAVRTLFTVLIGGSQNGLRGYERKFIGFDAEVLRDYVMATGDTRNPLTREEIAECVWTRLDHTQQTPIMRGVWMFIASGEAAAVRRRLQLQRDAPAVIRQAVEIWAGRNVFRLAVDARRALRVAVLAVSRCCCGGSTRDDAPAEDDNTCSLELVPPLCEHTGLEAMLRSTCAREGVGHLLQRIEMRVAVGLVAATLQSRITRSTERCIRAIRPRLANAFNGVLQSQYINECIRAAVDELHLAAIASMH